jgi:hypothetical protein
VPVAASGVGTSDQASFPESRTVWLVAVFCAPGVHLASDLVVHFTAATALTRNFSGGDEGNRTPDIYLAKVALCQLVGFRVAKPSYAWLRAGMSPKARAHKTEIEPFPPSLMPMRRAANERRYLPPRVRR